MFWPNVKKRLTAIAVQIGQAEKRGISNIAKSSYYRAATILTTTIIESVVFHLVKEDIKKTNNIFEKEVLHKQLHKLPKSLFNDVDGFYICQRIEKDVYIDDEGITFGKMNLHLKHKGIITQNEYKKLEFVRKERNKLHLQGLNKLDTGYTKKKFERITESLYLLLEKVPKSN